MMLGEASRRRAANPGARRKRAPRVSCGWQGRFKHPSEMRHTPSRPPALSLFPFSSRRLAHTASIAKGVRGRACRRRQRRPWRDSTKERRGGREGRPAAPRATGKYALHSLMIPSRS